MNMRVKQAYHLMGHEHVLKLNFLHYIVRLYRFWESFIFPATHQLNQRMI